MISPEDINHKYDRSIYNITLSREGLWINNTTLNKRYTYAATMEEKDAKIQ